MHRYVHVHVITTQCTRHLHRDHLLMYILPQPCVQDNNACASVAQHNWMSAVQIPPHWMDVTFGAPDLRLCYVTYQDLLEATPLVVTRSLIVKQDHSWVLHVNGHLVDPANVPSLPSFPPTLSSDSISLLLSQLGDLHTCTGNPEQKYV